ncbi:MULTISPECIES: PP2C family protein-serine/threonine phosphatase [unclassified Aeromicrobium]|jgi:protein phosphatase|uniref:PP2C family protein-serine/threonine phosphatase n=1 Tax=unclassified Aeromicrobium TaxID=2633570 RepID=UPI0009EA7B2E|nr:MULTISPECIES: protein phosphatase 2C domain-containing protein [unclassified Aeromicrobium]
MTSLTLRYVALTDVGLRRSMNQDSGYASGRLIAVADGMGGAAAGDLASAEAMNVIRQLDRELPDIDPLEALEKAVAHANHRLGELVQDDPSVEGMGTTLEAMLWDGERFATAHIGDSRAYLLRDGELTQISTDHTFVQSLVEEGKLTPEEARVHPHRSLLLRVMLGRDDNEADFDWFEGQLGDRFLLCSDGLSDMVDDATIERLLSSETIDAAASELVRTALENGGYDNVTVVIGELVEDDGEPDENLSSSDGQPQLVGAASGGPRPRTGQASGGTGKSRTRGEAKREREPDPEELRYAPVPPSKWRWVRRLVALAVVVGAIAAGLFYAYQWTQDQYYVAASDGKVTIYRGVQADIPLVTLQRVDEVTDIELDTLPAFRAEQVEGGLEADSRANAEQIVENLRDLAVVPEPTPSPSPTPSASASADDEQGA